MSDYAAWGLGTFVFFFAAICIAAYMGTGS
jgi:hypothetical protein